MGRDRSVALTATAAICMRPEYTTPPTVLRGTPPQSTAAQPGDQEKRPPQQEPQAPDEDVPAQRDGVGRRPEEPRQRERADDHEAAPVDGEPRTRRHRRALEQARRKPVTPRE